MHDDTAVTVLTPEDYDAFVALVDAIEATEPTQALVDLMKRAELWDGNTADDKVRSIAYERLKAMSPPAIWS